MDSIPEPESLNQFPSYCVKFKLFKRQFVGNRNNVILMVPEIIAKNTKEFIEKLWAISKEHISREIIITEESVTWSPTENPTSEEIDKFVIVSDKKSRKNYLPSEVDHNVLRSLQNKEVHVAIYTYSVSVSSQSVHNKVMVELIEKEKRYKQLTVSSNELMELAQKLKDRHGYRLQSDFIGWQMWAAEIQAAKPHLRDAMMDKSHPPACANNYFSSIPTNAESRMMNVRNGLVVARNVSSGRRQDLARLRTSFNTIKNSIKTIVEDFEHQLNVTEEKWDSNDSLIKDMETSVEPEETTSSVRFASQVNDMEDIDHADI